MDHGADTGWLTSLAALVHIFLLINLVAVGALVFIWLERKISGRIQDRLGPTRVGGKFGWLQTLADGIKLITKEDLMPDGADGLLFKLAPYVSFCASLAAFMAIPFAGGAYPLVAQHMNVAVFFILAVLGLEVFGVILAGYSLGVEVVAVRRDARSGPGGQLRSAAGHVRRRAGAARRLDGPGRHRRPAGRLVLELVHLPRPVHVHHVLGLLHLRDGERQPRAVRPGRSRERAGRRLPHRVLRPALELLLHGRVRLDARREPAGVDPVPRRLARADSRSPACSG